MEVENPMILNNWHDKLTEPETPKDFFGDEVTPFDDYVIDNAEGEVILRENLERYLKEHLGFEFKNEQ
ncbi:YqaI family protein [Bacillus halotolerans]|uniref:YqaI family protein n=1 Tax=Bacillus halotolerans TaxID=260554 RepID=UPI00384EBF0A